MALPQEDAWNAGASAARLVQPAVTGFSTVQPLALRITTASVPTLTSVRQLKVAAAMLS